MSEAFPVKSINPKCAGRYSNLDNVSELEFFCENGEWEKEKAADTVNRVVRLGYSVSRPDFGHK